MKRPRFRIGTLMVLVVIVALVVALVVERRKSRALLADAQAQAIEREMIARTLAEAMRLNVIRLAPDTAQGRPR